MLQAVTPTKQWTAAEAGVGEVGRGHGTLGGVGPSPDELQQGQNFPHTAGHFHG